MDSALSGMDFRQALELDLGLYHGLGVRLRFDIWTWIWTRKHCIKYRRDPRVPCSWIWTQDLDLVLDLDLDLDLYLYLGEILPLLGVQWQRATRQQGVGFHAFSGNLRL